jgi:DegV family protein with EDD domain
MTAVCILTDGSAQFSSAVFPGQKSIKIIPFDIFLNKQKYENGRGLTLADLPQYAGEKSDLRLSPPSPEIIYKYIQELSKNYEVIIGIFIADHISQCFANAQQAAHSLNGKVQLHLIDSQTISIGLGILVEIAASLVQNGTHVSEIERRINSLIQHSFSIISTPNLTYLYQSGFIDNAQAVISEMLGLCPIFSLESGKLTPIEKVRSHRHAMVFFQEFLEEFDELNHIALVQNASPNFKEAKLFFENSRNHFPHSSITKHLINLPAAVLFGPKTMGLFVLENPDTHQTK